MSWEDLCVAISGSRSFFQFTSTHLKLNLIYFWKFGSNPRLYNRLLFKGIVSWELRWVLLYINWMLFSGVSVTHYNILIDRYGTYFAIYIQKKIQRTSNSTIPDRLNNFWCGKHVCSAYSNSVIQIPVWKIVKFWRQNRIHELCSTVGDALWSRSMVQLIPEF